MRLDTAMFFVFKNYAFVPSSRRTIFVANVLILKVVSATFLLVWLVRLAEITESTYETKKNVFLFHFKTSFCS